MQQIFMDIFYERDRETRFDFIQSHFYTAEPQKIPSIKPQKRLKLKRKQLIKIYTTCFNMDNVYEHDVIREMICRINDCFGYKKPRATMGHHVPLGAGGDHSNENWYIQSRDSNTNQGNDLPLTAKMSWDEQVMHIFEILKDCPNVSKVQDVIDFLPRYEEIYDAQA